MLPTLFIIGSFRVTTITLFVILALIFSSFIFWRKGREEHYNEGDLFDGFVVSALLGLVASRLAFNLFNFQSFGLDVFKWFDFVTYPGGNLLVGLAVAALYLYKYAIKHKWDAFEVLDFWVTSISVGLSILYFGMFFNGTGYGYATLLPWGVVFPQLIDPHHPAQLYFSIFYLGMYFYLSRVEYNYRTFSWYRFGKKTAQTGFLTSTFLIFVSLFSLLMVALKPATVEFYSINMDIVFSFIMLISGVLLLYSRSGRPLPSLRKKSTKPQRTKVEKIGE